MLKRKVFIKKNLIKIIEKENFVMKEKWENSKTTRANHILPH